MENNILKNLNVMLETITEQKVEINIETAFKGKENNVLELSSLDFVNFIVMIEEFYEIEVPDEVLPSLIYIKDMIAVIEKSIDYHKQRSIALQTAYHEVFGES